MLRAKYLPAAALFSLALIGCGRAGPGTITPPLMPVVATPTFFPTPGTYKSPQSVTIADAASAATIYYTTDGSAPTANSAKYTSPIVVKIDTNFQAIAVASGYSNSAPAKGAYLIAGPTVSVVLSTHDQTRLMAAQPSVQFTANTSGANQVLVDETQQYQSIEGFGAAFTDSACYLLEKVAQPAALPGALTDLFTRSGNGIGLSFMRIPMGASDIALSVYSFDDQPAGQTDPTLADFSVAHDQSYIQPLILEARTLNPEMKLMANPWSPPGWMKTTDSMIGGTLLPTMDTPFANYFVKYLQAYQTAGLPIDYISLQNEPLYQPTGYPGMGMDARTQLTILRDSILPALASNHLTSRVLVYDHNWDTPLYPETIFADPTVLAADQVAGSAWHGYGGTAGAQQTVQNDFPTKGQWETEHSGATSTSDQFTSDFVEITQALRNSSKSYVKWSLALDENLGPNLTQNVGLGGCNTCTALVTVNSQSGAITKDVEFYTLGQYSKYVLAGATRIYSSNANGIVSAAFQNPDSSLAVIAFNDTAISQAFQLQWGTQNVSYTLPSLSAATFTWSGIQTGTATFDATSQIQASSYSTEQGLQTEDTADVNGGFDLGYISPGAYAVYKNVNFGTSVSTVNVRTASAGNGGTVDFHLDRATGPLIASVTLPVSGGWQNWQTVSAPASGASGIHDVYAVFSGGGATASIANMNWFQFQ